MTRVAGAGLKVRQQQLGHRSVTVTLDTHTHLFEADLDGVMDRLDTSSATKTPPERFLGGVVDPPLRTETLGT
jgi:hypothetical protein